MSNNKRALRAEVVRMLAYRGLTVTQTEECCGHPCVFTKSTVTQATLEEVAKLGWKVKEITRKNGVHFVQDYNA